MTPGEGAYAQREFGLAEDALRSVGALLDLRLLNDATSRLYYAVFHAAQAALVCRSRTARTNSGLVNVFGEEFGDEVLLRTLLGLRNQADYGKTELKASEATLRTYAVEAAAFVERCRAIVADAAASGADEPDPAPDL